MNRYNPVTPEILKQLESITGPRGVVTDPERLCVYSHDETSEAAYVRMPEVVVKPQDAAEVSEVLRLANREMVPVTPRGAGTGLSGGCVPMCGGIVLSMERMNRIIDLDRQNLFIVVEPGVTTGEIQRKAREEGLLYAGDPCSAESSQIGGNLAENAGGNKAVKYGTTARHVYGLEVVLPSGEIMRLGGKCVKDVTGYDLIHLMVGSEGTLGVITRAWLKLLPLPRFSVALLVPFQSMQTAIEVVPKIMTAGGIIPTSVEFMDSPSIKASERYLNSSLPYSDAGAYIVIELEGNSETQVESEYEFIGKLCAESGALEVFVADNLSTHDRIWKARKCIAEALRLVSPVYCMEDITVPTSEIPGLLSEITAMSSRHGVAIPCFGHAGDGNIHATLLRGDMDELTWERVRDRLLEEIYTATYSRGGNLSGEHGIGAKRLASWSKFANPAQITVTKSIKAALDPNGILNPGKVVR
ncbi:MAG: FAD-linked oxidase C-terminal domain-containing protein [Clostridia bacterium]|nr:FAD-linked oxidase C-terminal domain-containing protein [Clostridia bacterium]